MIELISVKKKYTTKAGETLALDEINLRFPDKGLIFITGKSGSGKTTLLNIIGGLDGFDEGEIQVEGKSFSQFSQKDFDSYRNTYVGFIFQEYNLLSEYSVIKNVEIANELQGKRHEEEKIASLFEKVDIAGLENRRVSQLSGGQKQRVAIVRALMKSSKIILADELTGALDSVTGEQVIKTLKTLSEDKLVIVVSHDLELAEKYADRIIRLVDGKIVEDITLREVEFVGNVYAEDGQLFIKTGERLTETETETLLTAIQGKKKINFTDKISMRRRSKTLQPERAKEDSSVKLIDSKMKFSSVLSLGLKSLLAKPVRLIVTILLSVIAFACCGVFDAISSYTDAKIVTGLLRENYYSALPAYTTYTDDVYEETPLKITQRYIDEVSEKTGYQFRGVYDLVDDEFVSVKGERENYNAYQIVEGLPSEKLKPQGAAYYYKSANGIIEFKQTEIDGDRVDPDGFDFTLLYGEYPALQIVGGQQAAISSYMAESILFWLQSEEVTTFGGKEVLSVRDLIGANLVVKEHVFVISGVIDCGEIPSKYDALKKGNDNALEADFATFLNAGCYLTIFAPEGYVQKYREQNDRTTCYFIDYQKESQRAILDGQTIKMAEYYYSIENEDKNIVYFDANKKSLGKNEALIDVNDLKKEYFTAEFEKASQEDRVRLDAAIWQIQYLTFETETQYRVYMDNFLQILDEVQQKNAQLTNSPEKTLTIRNYRNDDQKTYTAKQVKIVGVYKRINCDATVYTDLRFDAMMLSQEGLKELNLYEGQGVYSRMITPLYKNAVGEKAVGYMMDSEKGTELRWFKNSVLETIAADREMMSQFLSLFLYISIALSLFSVVMLFNYISASILAKKQSVGVLRALGANTKNIFTTFLMESLIISLANALLATLAAWIGCLFVNGYLVKIMNLSWKIATFGWRQVGVIVGGSVFAGLISSVVPIVKIAKEKPGNLIRKN